MNRQLIDYVRRLGHLYTPEALRERLLRHGYTNEQIDESPPCLIWTAKLACSSRPPVRPGGERGGS